MIEANNPIARREFLVGAGIAGAASLLVASGGRGEAQADISGDLVACVAGGAWETAFRDHMAKPFSEKHPGIKLHLDLTAGTAQLAKLRAARTNNPPFDVVLMLDEQMDIAMREGLIDPFDAREVPNVKDLYTVSTPAKWQKDGKFYAVHQNWGQLGIMYRTDKVKTPPKEWLDFWKPEYKGLVGMPPISYSVGLQFFIATVHALGGDEKNPADVDRAFDSQQRSQARRLRGLGIDLAPDEQASVDRQTGLARSLADVSAANLTTERVRDRQQALLGNPAPNIQGV